MTVCVKISLIQVSSFILLTSFMFYRTIKEFIVENLENETVLVKISFPKQQEEYNLVDLLFLFQYTED